MRIYTCCLSAFFCLPFFVGTAAYVTASSAMDAVTAVLEPFLELFLELFFDVGANAEYVTSLPFAVSPLDSPLSVAL